VLHISYEDPARYRSNLLIVSCWFGYGIVCAAEEYDAAVQTHQAMRVRSVLSLVDFLLIGSGGAVSFDLNRDCVTYCTSR